MKHTYHLLFTGMAALFFACTSPSSFPKLEGEYFGQRLPGSTPELFAPGIVSTGMAVRDVAMSPDGKEIYFGTILGPHLHFTIFVTKSENGRWTEPEPVEHLDNPGFNSMEPCLSPDGEKLFFLSTLTDSTGQGGQDIWVMDRKGSGWSKPYNLGAPVNSEHNEFFPSVTNDGTIYFSRALKGQRAHFIYRSRLVNGTYTEPEKLPEQVNSGPSQYNAFVAQDESYIIVPTAGRTDSYGGCDYYISFRNEDDSWTGPVNLGEKINTDNGQEYSPYVSPDGKYFFFMSTRPDLQSLTDKADITWSDLQQLSDRPNNGNSDIYWVDASFIHDLKPRN